MPHTAAHQPELETHVRSVMRAGVTSVPDDASVRQAQRALVAHRIHAVLIVGAGSGDLVRLATPA